jgi:hypothetical protein
MTDSNMPNQRNITLTIADLAIMASALSLARVTAMMYGSEGKRSRDRLNELTEMLNDMCPISKTDRDKEYSWFNAMSSVVNAQSWHLHMETTSGWSYKIEDVRIVMIVDGRRYNLTGDITVNSKEPVLPEKYQTMFDETLALAKEAASMEAEFMQEVVLRMPVVVENDNYSKRRERENFAASEMIAAGLKAAGVTDIPFHVRSLDYARTDGEEVMYDVTVLAKPSDEERLKAIFASEPESALKL